MARPVQGDTYKENSTLVPNINQFTQFYDPITKRKLGSQYLAFILAFRSRLHSQVGLNSGRNKGCFGV